MSPELLIVVELQAIPYNHIAEDYMLHFGDKLSVTKLYLLYWRKFSESCKIANRKEMFAMQNLIKFFVQNWQTNWFCLSGIFLVCILTIVAPFLNRFHGWKRWYGQHIRFAMTYKAAMASGILSRMGADNRDWNVGVDLSPLALLVVTNRNRSCWVLIIFGEVWCPVNLPGGTTGCRI